MDAELTSEDGTEQLKSRPYQSQLEEIAIRKNTIIHLPTGSGKTFIAIRLIKRFRDALQKPWGEGGKRTFFLVNTVPLVIQQKKCIERLCPVNGVGAYSSEDNVDYWDKAKWDTELEMHQVIVMTSQILCDMITHGYIKVEDINLLIFDECHHAVVDHPMRLIMKHFDNTPVTKQPRVLGLTATLLNANVNIHKVQETLRDLETTFHATIATVNDLGEVLNYSTNPYESVQYYKAVVPNDAMNTAISLLQELQAIVLSVKLPSEVRAPLVRLERGQVDITIDPKKTVKAVKNIITDMITLINELGVYGGALGVLAYIILLERLKRKAVTPEEELFYRITITHSTEARMVLLDSMEGETGYEKIIKHSSPKVLQILNVLKEYNPAYYSSPGALMKVNKQRKPISAIIFTQQRFTAKILYNLLNDVKKANPIDFGFIKHDFIVGFNVNPFKTTREQHYLKKSSQKALLKFSNKELNCLIATSVIEEGIDIPQCLLVLRYDPPLDYRSYIQSKGRARSADASFVILVEESNKPKFMGKYINFQKTEEYIQSILVGSIDDRDAPTDDDIREGLYEDDEIPPYVTENGNRLSATSAISLLNRYCSSLPHDQFTVITPMWIQEKIRGMSDIEPMLRMITIVMPIACPVKEKIKGQPVIKLKVAKRSAALNACIRLHQEGLLDALTLLPPPYGVMDFDIPEVNECFPNWKNETLIENGDTDTPKPGTRKMMRKHKKEFPSCLKIPQNGEFVKKTFYLHIIKLKTAFEQPNDSRERALFNLLQRKEGFGLLTPSPIPKLCDFPMFLTVGEVTTSLEVNYAVIELDVPLFSLVKEFHFFIFDQVLTIAKKFLVFDGEENNMFVVPVTEENGYDIDWAVMQTYKSIRPVEELSYDERKSLRVSKDSYQYSVVTPWYRGSISPDRYIVSDVIEYMTPKSHFDTISYGTYADYYSTKYNLEVLGSQDQPLLEVRNISTRMNCLMPRAATINAFTEKQQKLISAAQGDDKPKGFIEFFIPEFCVKYDFPGVLWYKAILLPSIIHRVFMLLIAHDLREEIARDTKYGKPFLSKGEEWLPLEVNKQIAIKSLLSQIEEPTPVNTIDRINNPIDESAPRNLNIVSMKETIYQLQNKKIGKEYPWDEKIEPVDIERNLSTVTVMDIECYEEFVSAPLKAGNENPKSPARPPPSSAAILPPPLKYNDQIALLTKQATGRGPELRDVLAALTVVNSHDTMDLERVETLGDSFLKFASTLYLFHKFPKLNEGQLTNFKGRLIGNRNLYYAGERKRLGGRMKVEQFTPRKDFLVPGFFAPKEAETYIKENNIRPTFLIGIAFDRSEALLGQLTTESTEMIHRRYLDCDGAEENEPFGRSQNVMQGYVKCQAVSDKSVADCVEALIGTYLLSGGIPGAALILEWLRIIPPQDNFIQILHKTVPTAITENKVSLKDLDYLLNGCRQDIERILDYKFKDPSFLLEAMSHPSYIRNRVTRSYERLEFLGDAILDFLITAHIFENCKQLKPGELTDLRSALVNNVTFASYVVKLGLYKFLCSQLNPSLDSAIMAFVEHQEQRGHEVIEDVLYLIDEDECHISEYVEVPKVLSDIFESLVGAIYLDSGGDLKAVWAIVYRIMWKEIDLFSNRVPQQPVRVLYEKIHACPVFGDSIVTKADVPKVMIPVTVTKHGRQHTIHGFGNNKFQAKRAAAKLALKILAL